MRGQYFSYLKNWNLNFKLNILGEIKHSAMSVGIAVPFPFVAIKITAEVNYM